MDATRPSGGRASGRGLSGPAIAGPAPLLRRPPTPLGAFALRGWWSPLGLGVVPPFRCGCSRAARPACWAVVLAGWPVVGLKCSRCDGLSPARGGGVRMADNGHAHLVLAPSPCPLPAERGRGWPAVAGPRRRGGTAPAPGARKAGRARQKKQRARRMGAVIERGRSGAAGPPAGAGPRHKGPVCPAPSGGPAAAGSRAARPRGVRARPGNRGRQAAKAPKRRWSPHAHRPLETSRRPRTHPCARGRAGALTGFPFSREIVKKITQLTDRRMV